VAFLLFVTWPARTQAQPLLVGVKGGLSIPQLKGGGTPQSEGYTSRLAPNFGAFVTYPLGERFGVQGEVLYSGQGGQRLGMQPIFAGGLSSLPVPEGVTVYANFENETVLNYLEIPLLARYFVTGTGSDVAVHVDAGPYVGFLLNATVVTSGMSSIYRDREGTQPVEILGNPLPPVNFENEQDVKSNLNTVNMGLAAAVGMNFPFYGQQLGLDIRGVYGLTPLQADEKNGSNSTGALVLTLGYGFSM
jgi:hypothetical protein